jgi:hypothetical protein
MHYVSNALQTLTSNYSRLNPAAVNLSVQLGTSMISSLATTSANIEQLTTFGAFILSGFGQSLQANNMVGSAGLPPQTDVSQTLANASSSGNADALVAGLASQSVPDRFVDAAQNASYRYQAELVAQSINVLSQSLIANKIPGTQTLIRCTLILNVLASFNTYSYVC